MGWMGGKRSGWGWGAGWGWGGGWAQVNPIDAKLKSELSQIRDERDNKLQALFNSRKSTLDMTDAEEKAFRQQKEKIYSSADKKIYNAEQRALKAKEWWKSNSPLYDNAKRVNWSNFKVR